MSRLILGTAQWGLNYGISNNYGITPSHEVSSILNRASSCGIQILDTAPAYGSSEKKIGEFNNHRFKVISKIPSLKDIISTKEKIKTINESVENSLSNLGVNSIFGVLFHDANDLIKNENIAIYEALKRFKEKGLVKNIGVSIYTQDEIDIILSSFVPDIVQLPFNILDQRLLKSGHLTKLKSLGVKIHARSVFLQGLFHMPVDDLPDFFNPIKSVLSNLHFQAQKQGFSMNQAALSFVRDHPDIDNVLIGVESLAQVNAAIKDFSISGSFNPSISLSLDEKFLNPSKWSLHDGC